MVRRVLGAVTILLVLVLAACTGGSKADDPPTTAPPASESPSPSESATLEKPEMPDAAKQPTEAGAIAFLSYYWVVVDYAGLTGDLRDLKSLSAPACAGCDGGVEGLERVHDAGGVVRGAPASVTRPRTLVSKLGDSTIVTVDATIVFPPSTHDYGAGDERNKDWPGGPVNMRFTMAWTPEERGWLLTEAGTP